MEPYQPVTFSGRRRLRVVQSQRRPRRLLRHNLPPGQLRPPSSCRVWPDHSSRRGNSGSWAPRPRAMS